MIYGAPYEPDRPSNMYGLESELASEYFRYYGNGLEMPSDDDIYKYMDDAGVDFDLDAFIEAYQEVIEDHRDDYEEEEQ